MEIDKYLSERLTNDNAAKAVEDNYRGLMEVPGIERNPMQERDIKLNRLERLMTPAKPDKVTTNTVLAGKQIKIIKYYCPNCRAKYYNPHNMLALGSRLVKHCDQCGQALDWSDVLNESESE